MKYVLPPFFLWCPTSALTVYTISCKSSLLHSNSKLAPINSCSAVGQFWNNGGSPYYSFFSLNSQPYRPRKLKAWSPMWTRSCPSPTLRVYSRPRKPPHPKQWKQRHQVWPLTQFYVCFLKVIELHRSQINASFLGGLFLLLPLSVSFLVSVSYPWRAGP